MTSWIAASAVVVGDVTLAEDVSVWPTAVIRGDVERIVIGYLDRMQCRQCDGRQVLHKGREAQFLN